MAGLFKSLAVLYWKVSKDLVAQNLKAIAGEVGRAHARRSTIRPASVYPWWHAGKELYNASTRVPGIQICLCQKTTESTMAIAWHGEVGGMSIDSNVNHLGTTNIKIDIPFRLQEFLIITYYDSNMDAIHSQDRVAGASYCERIERSEQGGPTPMYVLRWARASWALPTNRHHCRTWRN